MNNLRTLILIPVFIIQISGILSNIIWDWLLTTELSARVSREIKREILAKTPEALKDFHMSKSENLKCDNNPIYRKEAQLRYEISTKVIVKKSESLSVKMDSTEIRRSVKKVSVITNVLFNGTGNAELF